MSDTIDMKRFMIFIILSVFLSFASTAHAQENNFSLGIIPPVIEIQATSPARIESIITLQNLADTPRNLDIIFKSFKPSGRSDGTLTYLASNGIEGPDPLILQKVKVFDETGPIDQLTLNPLESKDLKLVIELDKSSPNGDYYFSPIFVSKQTENKESSSSQLPGGIGTNVILTVGERGATSGSIEEFGAPLFKSTGPVPITLLVSNNSNHFITPTGRISIKDMFGKNVAEIPLLSQYILANSTRYLVDAQQASPSAEFLTTISSLSRKHNVIIWPEKFLFGFYTVTAHLRLTPESPMFERTTTFFAIPIYLVFAISFFIFLVLGVWFKVKKKI